MPKIQNLHPFIRLAIVLAAFALYFITFYFLVPEYGRVIGLASILPILFAVWSFGLPGAVVSALCVFPLNSLVLLIRDYGEALLTLRRFSLWFVAIILAIVFAFFEKMRRQRDESEERLKLALEAANEGLWDFRPSTGELVLNPSWYTMLGYEAYEFPPNYKEWLDRVHPDDAEAFKEAFRQAAEDGGARIQTEFRMKAADAEWKWVLMRGKSLTLPDRRWERIIGITTDISDRKNVEKELIYLACYDPLTGLLNRRSFYERSKDSLIQAARSDKETLRGFLLVDIDSFKDINESLGHEFGDKVLVAAAERLKKQLRESDYLFRTGGDEFTIILNKVSHNTDAAIVADRIISSFQAPFEIEEESVYLEVSIGISIYPQNGNNTGALLRNAGTALYEAKRERNSYRFHTHSMQIAAIEKITTINKLRRGIEENEFLVYYQPILNRERRVIGAEALLRWDQSEMGIVSPAKFISLAEDTGLIIPIGSWVLEEACRAHAKLSEEGFGELSMSVNFSVRQMRSKQVNELISHALEQSNGASGHLHLEITESCFIENVREILRKLEDLRTMGIHFAIDDFGTGYSSLSYLKRLPVETVKIDRAFIFELPENHEDASIVRSILQMAHGLGLEVIAEGVDAEAQHRFLEEIGCDAFQGYLYSEPLPFEDFFHFVKRN